MAKKFMDIDVTFAHINPVCIYSMTVVSLGVWFRKELEVDVLSV